MILRVFSVVAVIGVLFVGEVCKGQSADGDDEDVGDALRAVNDIKWLQLTVRILDPDGMPVKDAKVRPWALRAGNGHGPWPEPLFGAPRTTATNDMGTTDVTYPRRIAWGGDKMLAVVQVSLMIEHPDYCASNVHVDVPKAGDAVIRDLSLQRGFRLRIAGVAPGSDKPLSHCHLLFENDDTGTSNGKEDSEGWLRSNPLRADQRWFRIVRIPPDEPAQFSKPMAWSPDDPKSMDVRVEIRPGVRVRGVVSENVPRPIERGRVVAWCGSRVQRDDAGNQPRTSPVFWIETTDIERDGTFEFSSLPSGYLAQFYAYANDTISAQPSDDALATATDWFGLGTENRNDVFRYGQIHRLTGGKTELTLEMESAGSVRIKCVDRQGNALPGISVSSWPNQYMVGGGSTIFCGRFSSSERLRNKNAEKVGWDERNPYSAVTNVEGIAVIRSLPSREHPIFAANHRWISKDEEKITAKAGESIDATLKLKRRTQKSPF